MKNKIVSNFVWRLLERFGAQSVSFIVSIILSRLLDPEIYGTVALVTVIIAILGVFVDSGFSTALIQKKEVDDLDYSSVFYFSLFICITLYVVLFFVSPIIANFYNNTELTNIIRVLGLTLIISGFKSIQNAYVTRNMIFKKYFFSTLGGTIVSAIVGVVLAYLGYGVWALVFQSLANNLIDAIILWFTVDWKPKLMFSISRLTELFSYGWKLLISSLLDTTYNQLTQLIIGKKYSSSDLAFYNKGNQLPDATTSAILISIDSVLFPTMSKKQENKDDVKNICRKSIKISSYVLWPMMIGLTACSDNLIRLLLTDKWAPAIPYLRIFCIIYAFYPIHTSNLNAIKALGRSDLFLKLEIMKKVVGLTIILISMQYGVYAMALSTIISSVISQIINSWPNKKLLNYSYIEQIKDILPSLLLSTFMGIIVYCVNLLNLDYLIALIIQIMLGIIIYIGLSYLLKFDSFLYCFNVLKNIINKKKTKKNS